jgi:hypothetical protein
MPDVGEKKRRPVGKAARFSCDAKAAEEFYHVTAQWNETMEHLEQLPTIQPISRGLCFAKVRIF